MTVETRTPPATLPVRAGVVRPSVVVGYTDGPAGEAALREAGIEAQLRGGSLTVVHGLIGAEAPQRYGRADQELDRRQRALRRIVAQAQDVLPRLAASDVRVLDGSIADELVTVSTRSELLVIGATTDHAVLAAAFDTAPYQVVRRSACPVLVVPAAARLHQVTRVVCGFDRSPESLVALRWAADDATTRGVPLLVADTRSPHESNPTVGSDGLFLQVWLARHAPDLDASVVLLAGHRLAEQLLEVAVDDGLLVISRSPTGFHVGFPLVQVLTAQTRVPVVAVPA